MRTPRNLLLSVTACLLLLSAAPILTEPPSAFAASDRYAIVIGVADYPGDTQDRSWVADTDDQIVQTLIDDCEFLPENILHLEDNAAHVDGIARAITDWLDPLESSSSTVFIYFTGHGGVVADAAPLDEDDGLDEVLCAWDGYIRDDTLRQLLDRLESQNIVVVVDACHSGGHIDDELEPESITTDVSPFSDISGPGIQVVTSSQEDELSWRYEKLNSSVFSFYFTRALSESEADLDNDGAVSAEEAFRWASPRVIRYQAWGYSGMFDDKYQNPMFHDGTGHPIALGIQDSVDSDDVLPGRAYDGSWTNGDLTLASDPWDIYNFQLEAGETVQIDVSGGSAEDIRAYLLPWDFEDLSDAVAVSLTGEYPRSLEYTVPLSRGGTYFLWLQTWTSDSSYGVYKSVGPGLMIEPDDAFPGTILGQQHFEDRLHKVADAHDLRRIELSGGDTITADLTGDPGTNFGLWLYPAGSTEFFTGAVAAGESETRTDSLTYTVPLGQGGTYYLDTAALFSSGGYTLDVTTTDGDDLFPGIPMPAGLLSDSLDAESDECDWHYVDGVEVGDTIGLTLTGEPGTEFTVILTDGEGTRGTATSSGQPVSLNRWVRSTDGDRWMIGVVSNGGTGDYGVSWWTENGSPPQQDDHVPGAPLPASPFTDSLNPSGDAADCFSIDLIRDDVIDVSLNAAPGTEFELWLLPPNWPIEPAVAQTLAGPYPLDLTYRVPRGRGGTYHVMIAAGDAESSGYQLDWSVTGAFPETADPSPFMGTDRFGTAVELSRNYGVRTPRTVVLTTGMNWPDALGGAALAGVYDGILLPTLPDSIPLAVRTRIQELDPEFVFILGGTSAVSQSVEDDVAGLVGGENVLRISGSDRFETANNVALKVIRGHAGSYDGTAFVATGLQFPDALSASPLSASKGWPTFLAGPSGLSAETIDTMDMAGVTDVVILGGNSAINATTEQALQTRFGSGHVTRLSGSDRYATSLATARFAVENGLGWNGVAFATGENFPDALAAGPIQARSSSVMLLTRGSSADPAVIAALTERHDWIGEYRFIGGEQAIAPATREALTGALD